MGHSQFDSVAARPAWNAGRKPGAKRPLKPKQVWAVRFWLERERRLRDRALFDLAIDSKLRGGDLVKVRIGDLVSGGRVRHRAIIVQRKTGRPVQFELLEPARASILEWLERRGGTLDDFAFPSRTDQGRHISTRQYARLVDEWVGAIGLRREDYGTHSLRRTKAAIIYKQTGNLRAVQILLGHTKMRQRSATWAWRKKTRWRLPKAPRCEQWASCGSSALLARSCVGRLAPIVAVRVA